MKVKYIRYGTVLVFTVLLSFLFLRFTTLRTRASSTSVSLRFPLQGTQRISSSRISKIIVYNKSKQIAEFSDVKIENVNGFYQANFTLQDTNPSDFYAFFIKPNLAMGKIICATPNTTTCNNPSIILKNGDNMIEDTTEPLYVGDLNMDGVLNGADASILFANLGKNDSISLNKSDLNADGIVDAQDYSLLLFSLGKNPLQPTPGWINSQPTQNPTSPPMSPTQVQQPSPSPTSNPTPTPIPQPSPTIAPTNTPPPQTGACHAIKPGLAGGGAYDLKNGESSECTCTMGVCAQAKCNSCKTGVCDCGEVPLQMPPTTMNCTGGANFTIQICTK